MVLVSLNENYISVLKKIKKNSTIGANFFYLDEEIDIIKYIKSSEHYFYAVIISSKNNELSVKYLEFITNQCKNIETIFVCNDKNQLFYLHDKFPSIYFIIGENFTQKIFFAIEQCIKKRNIGIERDVLDKINLLSIDINSASELDYILYQSCKHAVDIFSVDHSGLVLKNDDNISGKLIAEYPEKYNTENIIIPIKGVNVEEEIFFKNKIINISDVESNKNLGPIKDLFNSYNIKSILIVPVVVYGQTIGSFSLDMMTRKRSFNSIDIELARKLANHIAVAITIRNRFNRYANEINYKDPYKKHLYNSQIESPENNLIPLVLRTAKEFFSAEDVVILLFNKSGLLEVFISLMNKSLNNKVITNCNNFKQKSLLTKKPKNFKKTIDEKELLQAYNDRLIFDLSYQKETNGYLIIYFKRKLSEHELKYDKSVLNNISIILSDLLKISNKFVWLKAIFTNSPYAIICIDIDGYITEINREAINLLGYDDNVSLKSMNIIDIYWDGIEEAKKIKKQLLENPIIKNIETNVKDRFNNRAPILLTATILYNEFGENIGSIGIMEDQRLISFRGRTERIFKSIQEVNQNYFDKEQLFLSILLGAIDIYKADAGSIYRQDGSILNLLQSYPSSDILQKEVMFNDQKNIFFDSKSNSFTLWITNMENSIYSPILNAESKSACCMPIVCGTELTFFLYLESYHNNHSFSYTDIHGFLSQYFSIVLERYFLNKIRKNTRDKMLSASNAVAAAQIGTSLIHEIKNPLNNIALTLDDLSNHININEDIRFKNKYLGKINIVKQQILRTYNLALKLQKFEDNLKPQKANIYINNVVLSALEITESTFHSKKIKAKISLDNSLNPPKTKHENIRSKGNPICVDEYQIEQSLINMFLNAIHASHERSAVQIRTHNLKNRILISIQDFGEGIIERNLKKVFEPFFTTKSDGVGLGLFICHLLLVENHHCTIDIETKKNKGTTFNIYIPFDQKNQIGD